MPDTTATRPDLRELLARVEAAEGPSMELDMHIICALLAPEDATVKRGRVNDIWCIYSGLDLRGQPRLWEHCPLPLGRRNVTASFDAALSLLTLVVPEWLWSVQPNFTNNRTHVAALWSSKHPAHIKGYHDTPALAILAALLKALIEQEAET